MDIAKLSFRAAGAAFSAVISWHAINYLFPWLKYDIRTLKVLFIANKQMKDAEKHTPVYTFVEKLIDQAKSIPNKVFIYYKDEIWSYKTFNEYCNQVARVMYETGYRKGDVVAIFMHSCPQYIGMSFGVAKTGASTAFINNGLRGNSLLHCLRVSRCKSIVVPNEQNHIKAIEEIEEELKKDGIAIFVLGNVDAKTKVEYKKLNELTEKQSKSEVPSEWRNSLNMKDHFCYVYTSGTTGLPKAAIIRHDRSWLVGSIFIIAECSSDDIVYSPLPLFHSSAGIIGVFGTINQGCAIAVRDKFSASNFWKDCRKFKATYAQYIGETIRYVCDQPPHPDDKKHCLKNILGNGLRPEVWKTFSERFGKHIRVREFYGATEGNTFFINSDNCQGSVGMLSPIIKAAGLARLIKYDMETESIVRDANGRCIEVPDGTPGLLIGKISDRTPFNGYYRNEKQTQSKTLRNVFKDGDAFFNTGDLLRRDPDYHVYFIDRIGDTFRWKGNNVSTNEVSDIMSSAPGLKEVNVYGVEIPGNEGRAGMMAVLLKDDTELDCVGVFKYARENLTSYARPLFLRVKKELDLTGTFKQKKVQLRNEGFNPVNMNGDPIYYLDNLKSCYSLLSQEVYENIVNNEIRL